MAQAIEEPFVTAVKEALGDRFTPSMEVIYRKIIKFILATLTAGLRRQTPPRPSSAPGESP